MPLTPEQSLGRRRAEAVIAVIAPVLDLVLKAGDRVSRIAAGGDSGQHPIRSAPSTQELRAVRTIGRGDAEEQPPEPGDDEVVEGEPVS